MIELQYRDYFEEAYQHHSFPDDRYTQALEYYDILKKDWEETRVLLQTDGVAGDWVVIIDDSVNGRLSELSWR